MLHPLCLTDTWSCNARIDGAMRRKTQSVSQLDVHISVREMQSFAYSPLSGIPDSLRTWIFDPRRVSTSTSWLVVIFYVHMEIVQFRACVKNGQICTFWGVPPKMVENAHFGGVQKPPILGVSNLPKTRSGGHNCMVIPAKLSIV